MFLTGSKQSGVCLRVKTFCFLYVFFLLFITKEGTGTDIVVYRENAEKEETLIMMKLSKYEGKYVIIYST